MPYISEKRRTKNGKRKTGFTLIELIISVSIIAIISAIGLVSYSQTQLIARDAKRKADLRSIAVALELYNQTNKRYPCSGDTQFFFSTSATPFWITDSISQGNCNNTLPLTPLNSSYINFMPKDPINTGDPNSATNYGYSYSAPSDASSWSSSCPSGDSQYYVLKAKLENVNDPDSCKNKLYQRCGDTGTTSTWGCGNDPIANHDSMYILTSQ